MCSTMKRTNMNEGIRIPKEKTRLGITKAKMDIKIIVRLTVISCVIAIAVGHGGSNDEDAETHTNLRRKSLVLVKVWSLLIVFFATFLGGISPYFLRWNHTFLVLGVQFAGGVFLGTALMHFLSDSAETFGDLTTKTYPFAFMLCTAGYFATMLADIAVVWVYGKTSVPSTSIVPPMIPLPPLGGGTVASAPSPHSGETPLHVQVETPQHGSKEGLEKRRSVGESMLLIGALCFHSVFEGIAIGVENDSSGAWRALWTVCLHKIFAAIAMGIALLQMIPQRPLLSTLIYSFAFAISTPIGVAIGILIDATSEGRAADWVYAISMGFACGVFVYVAVNHLLGKRLFGNSDSSRRPGSLDRPSFNYLAGLLGAGTIAVAMIWD